MHIKPHDVPSSQATANRLALQKRTGTKPDSDLANLGKTSPHHFWGRDSREREREEQGLPKCIRFSPEPPLIDPLLSFRGDASTVRLPAFVLLVLSFHSALFARFRRCVSCWTLLVFLPRASFPPLAVLALAPTSLSGHVPGALANRPKPCLGCFVYSTGQKPTTSSRARLLGAVLQATDHRWLTFME